MLDQHRDRMRCIHCTFEGCLEPRLAERIQRASETDRENRIDGGTSERAEHVKWFAVLDVVLYVCTHKIELRRRGQTSKGKERLATYTFLDEVLYIDNAPAREQWQSDVPPFLGLIIIAQGERRLFIRENMV